VHLWKILRCNEAVPPVGGGVIRQATWEAPAQTELRPTAPGLLAAHGLQLRLGIENEHEHENERDRRGPTWH
jgi:hypothetical protein